MISPWACVHNVGFRKLGSTLLGLERFDLGFELRVYH